ncbi:MAG: hypothetical protein SF053_22195 [Bacteroidia bacterium]|nr:hypothetical protein [Bacteroidia bacterium]
MNTNVKIAYTCRQVGFFQAAAHLNEIRFPKAGDVALWEVISIGKHSAIQGTDRALITIMPGDQLLMTFGNRYASEQFEGYVPETPVAEAEILGQGGVVGYMASVHATYRRVGTTKLRLLGYALDEQGQVINTLTYRRVKQNIRPLGQARHKVILSVGASMDSGKTTSAAYLVRGLKAAGYRTAFIKLTGTAFTKDPDFVRDMGADLSIDFTRQGYPSTYMCSEAELISLYHSLIAEATDIHPEYIVIEIADGLLQRETAMLLSHKGFMDTVDHVLFSCGDSLAAVGGVQVLTEWGIAPFALAGMITTSPLMQREAENRLLLPVLKLDQLAQAQVVNYLRPARQEAMLSPAQPQYLLQAS